MQVKLPFSPIAALLLRYHIALPRATPVAKFRRSFPLTPSDESGVLELVEVKPDGSELRFLAKPRLLLSTNLLYPPATSEPSGPVSALLSTGVERIPRVSHYLPPLPSQTIDIQRL